MELTRSYSQLSTTKRKPNPLLIRAGLMEVERFATGPRRSYGRHLIANLTHGDTVYVLHATKGYRRRK